MGLTVDDLKKRPVLAKQLVAQHTLLGSNGEGEAACVCFGVKLGSGEAAHVCVAIKSVWGVGWGPPNRVEVQSFQPYVS
jgi:hypothetical protein